MIPVFLKNTKNDITILYFNKISHLARNLGALWEFQKFNSQFEVIKIYIKNIILYDSYFEFRIFLDGSEFRGEMEILRSLLAFLSKLSFLSFELRFFLTEFILWKNSLIR